MAVERISAMTTQLSASRTAKFGLGQIVCHRIFPFRGVVFDVDAEYSKPEEAWAQIPVEMRPNRNQPFYSLLAESEDGVYVAYVAEGNLVPDESGEPVDHPQADFMFSGFDHGHYLPRHGAVN